LNFDCFIINYYEQLLRNASAGVCNQTPTSKAIGDVLKEAVKTEKQIKENSDGQSYY
jgi:hypothetical protein